MHDWPHKHCNTWFRLAHACIWIAIKCRSYLKSEFYLIYNQVAAYTINTFEPEVISRQLINPHTWLTMNLILVKFNLKRTSGCKLEKCWDCTGRRRNKTAWTGERSSGAQELRGQERPKQGWRQQGKCGNCRNIKLTHRGSDRPRSQTV